MSCSAAIKVACFCSVTLYKARQAADKRKMHLVVSDHELARRREAVEARGDKAWMPVDRKRVVSLALRAYAALATSADRGAVRDISQLKRN